MMLSRYSVLYFSLGWRKRNRPNNLLLVSMQTDLKKLLRNPPLVKIPKAHDLISANPLLGALPPAVRDKIVGSTKETMKLRAVSLYREESKANGVWLISNGVVKVIDSFS